MKIVSWNCNGAFRRKFQKISELQADIYVIQECEDPKRTNHQEYQDWAINHLWIGDTKNKGLGIFARSEIKLELLNWTNQYLDHTVKYFLPCRVNDKLNLLSIWAHQNNSPNFGYIGQVWKYLTVNKGLLKEAFLIGDFNSNTNWDQWDRWWNHSDVVRELDQLGLKSFYHHFLKEEQGKESIPTLYFRKNKDRGYHIDYMFGPKKSILSLSEFQIGESSTWLEFSDHMPLICTIR